MNCQNKIKQIYERRFDFADNSLNNIINSINDDKLRNHFRKFNSKIISVGVFGKSQTGKTTLILKLLGISEKDFKELEEVLRYGREKGKSVTLIPTKYSRSENNHFSIKYLERSYKKVSKDELIQELTELRELGEKGNLEIKPDKILHIKIPKNYFDQEYEEFHIDVIDMPGIGSRIANEHNFVDKVLRNLLITFDVVLIISRSTKIEWLKNLNYETILHWKYMPNIFWLVITFAYSPHSVSETMPDKINKDSFIKYFRNIFDTKSFSIKPETKLFPLEYGESWSNFKRK